jgi:hydroxymethylbilane synthase
VTLLRLVARGSPLSLAQAEIAIRVLKAADRSLEITLETRVTAGDRNRSTPLSELGGRGVFVDGIRHELLSEAAQMAVHSLKDVPTEGAPGLVLGAVLRRGDARDAFVGAGGAKFADLLPGSTVGTSSTRRTAMLQSARPDIEVVPMRGNVGTRIQKLTSGEVDGLVLAGVGLERIGLASQISEWLDPSIFIPSPGQGAIALECRADDTETLDTLKRVDDALTRATTTAERSFLAVQGSNCALPAGALAEIGAGRITLRGTLSGQASDAGEIEGPLEDAAKLGAQLGEDLRSRLRAQL